MAAAETLQQRAPARARGLLAGSLVALLAGLLLGIGGWIRFASQVPAYAPPVVLLPMPNAYSDYCAAVRLLPPAAKALDLRRAGTEELRTAVAAGRPALDRLRQGSPHEYRNPPCVSFSQMFPE